MVPLAQMGAQGERRCLSPPALLGAARSVPASVWVPRGHGHAGGAGHAAGGGGGAVTRTGQGSTHPVQLRGRDFTVTAPRGSAGMPRPSVAESTRALAHVSPGAARRSHTGLWGLVSPTWPPGPHAGLTRPSAVAGWLRIPAQASPALPATATPSAGGCSAPGTSSSETRRPRRARRPPS